MTARTDAKAGGEAGGDRLSPPVRVLLRRAEDSPDREVKPGDRVALHMRNTAEAVLGYLACLRLGAIVIPLNPRLATRELSNLVVRTRLGTAKSTA
ncbi:MAG: AMP-binding protein [Trebonia sp.]